MSLVHACSSQPRGFVLAGPSMCCAGACLAQVHACARCPPAARRQARSKVLSRQQLMGRAMPVCVQHMVGGIAGPSCSAAANKCWEVTCGSNKLSTTRASMQGTADAPALRPTQPFAGASIKAVIAHGARRVGPLQGALCGRASLRVHAVCARVLHGGAGKAWLRDVWPCVALQSQQAAVARHTPAQSKTCARLCPTHAALPHHHPQSQAVKGGGAIECMLCSRGQCWHWPCHPVPQRTCNQAVAGWQAPHTPQPPVAVLPHVPWLGRLSACPAPQPRKGTLARPRLLRVPRYAPGAPHGMLERPSITCCHMFGHA